MKHDILIKPLSIKIIRLLTNNELTIKEISEKIPEISKASLYRHIKKMYDEDIIKVTTERLINGITEKTYTFAIDGGGNLSQDYVNNLSEKEYKTLFAQFIAMVTGDFENSIKDCEFSEIKNNTSFTQTLLYISDEERKEFNEEFATLLKKYINNKSTINRKKKILSIISMPTK